MYLWEQDLLKKKGIYFTIPLVLWTADLHRKIVCTMAHVHRFCVTNISLTSDLSCVTDLSLTSSIHILLLSKQINTYTLKRDLRCTNVESIIYLPWWLFFTRDSASALLHLFLCFALDSDVSSWSAVLVSENNRKQIHWPKDRFLQEKKMLDYLSNWVNIFNC